MQGPALRRVWGDVSGGVLRRISPGNEHRIKRFYTLKWEISWKKEEHRNAHPHVRLMEGFLRKARAALRAREAPGSA